MKTLAPAPTRANPAEVAAYIVKHYGEQAARYVKLMVNQNTKAGCAVAVDWWHEVGASLASVVVDEPVAADNPMGNPIDNPMEAT